MGITSHKNLYIKKKQIQEIKPIKNIPSGNNEIKVVKNNESIKYINLRKTINSSYIIKQLFSFLS